MENFKEKRGFTLIELLIVTVVIATLMGLVFRLAGVGSDAHARNVTVTRMQKLEFALSGYFAAFGSYPPVPLHASRDIYRGVNPHGIQLEAGKNDGNGNSSELNWTRVQAACLAQPVACEFPFNDNHRATQQRIQEVVKLYARAAKRYPNSSYNYPIYKAFRTKIQIPSSDLEKYHRWQDIQLFKFGVMSFLLPRYLFMLGGEKELYDSNSKARTSGQWASQNDISRIYDFETGRQLWSKWQDVQSATHQNESSDTKTSDLDSKNYRTVANQPSQAVCARWMQALEGIVSGGRIFFGVNTAIDGDQDDDDNAYHVTPGSDGTQMRSAIYSPDDAGDPSGENYSNQYILDGMTVRDGWGNDLYYYSPAPYQGYRVWSSGANGKTIPPWIDISTLQNKDKETAAEWLADDIVHLSTR